MTFVITKTLYVIPALCDECLVVVLNLIFVRCAAFNHSMVDLATGVPYPIEFFW